MIIRSPDKIPCGRINLKTNRTSRLALALVCLLALASVVSAQPSAPPATAQREPLTLEVILQRRAQAESAPDVDDETRQTITELYTSAAAHVERAAALAKRQLEYTAAIAGVDERLAEIQQQLQGLKEQEPSPPAKATQSYLDQETLRRQQHLEAARQALVEIEQQVNTRPARRREIRSRLAIAEQEIQRLEREIEANAPTGEQPLLTLAKQTEIIALQQQLDVEIPALRDELALYDAEDAVEYLRFRRELATAQIALAEAELKLVTDAAKRVREQTAQETVEETREEAAAVDPAFHKLAERNNELARLYSKIAQQVTAAEEERDQIQADFEALKRDFEISKQKVASVVGLPASLGAVLRKQRSELPVVRSHLAEIRERQKLIDEAQLALFDLRERRSKLPQIETEIQSCHLR